jgi:hypothetical protein
MTNIRSLHYVRERYRAPAWPNGRVRYHGGKNPRDGTIISGESGYLIIQLDGETVSHSYHPTYKLEYLDFFIVMLEEGVWLTYGDGDPPRTTVNMHALVFDCISKAKCELDKARQYRPFPNAIITFFSTV